MTLLRIFLMLSCLSGCGTLQEPRLQAQELAGHGKLVPLAIQAPPFVLQTFVRITDEHQPVRVYIEGDGFAWVNKHQLSNDPTPHQPLALALAASDSSINVAYLGRPCQYLAKPIKCDSTYWSNRRFAPEVIQSMDEAISSLKMASTQPVELVGYSGGAAIAVILAAQRQDIIGLRTVAGNLDHQKINRYHGVDEMPESLNPSVFAPQLKTLPQIHYVGGEDRVIPMSLAEDFVGRQGKSLCAHIHVVEGVGHQEGWQQRWPELLNIHLDCKPSIDGT